MTEARSLVPQPATTSTAPADLAQVAGAADRAAAQSAFVRYRATKAAATLRAQDADLRRWVAYLAAVQERRFWASHAEGDVFTLQEAGGWSSLDMPRRYHKRQQIANQGLRVPSERKG